MRLKTVAADEAYTSYRFPMAPTVAQTKPLEVYEEPQAPAQLKKVRPPLAHPKRIVCTAMSSPLTSKSRSRTWKRPKIKIRTRLALLLLIAFFLVPWMPPAHVASKADFSSSVVPVGSANTFYTSLDTEARRRDHELWNEGIAKPQAGEHVLPSNYHDPENIKVLERIRAVAAKDQHLLDTLKKGLTLPNDTKIDGGIKIWEVVTQLTKISQRAGMLKALDGDHLGASEAYLNAIELGIQTKMYCEFALEDALEALPLSASKLSPIQARVVHARLEGLMKRRPELIAELEAERESTAKWIERRAYPAEENTFPSVTFISRIPIIRVLVSYRVSRYRSQRNRNLDLMRAPDAETVKKLKTPVAWWELDSNQFLYDGQIYDQYTKNSEKAQALLKQLKARAGEG